VSDAAQYILNLPHEESYLAQDFIVTESNRTAYLLATDETLWQSPVASITAPAGAGKTHLAHIACERWRSLGHTPRLVRVEEYDALLATTLAETLITTPCALELPSIITHEDRLAQCINVARARSIPLLLTSRTTPIASTQVRLKDLSSRLKSVLEIALAAPDDTLLEVMLSKAFVDRQLRASEDVIAYLLKRLERSGAMVRMVVDTLDRSALAQQRTLTIPFVRDTLANFR
jgi:chromosomal replication initiation ATPase DnaA